MRILRATADRRAGAGHGGTALVPTAALLWGLQFSFLNPALALLLTSVYGAGPAQVGWCLAVYNAAGFVAAVVLPVLADRIEDDVRPMLGCALLTVALAAVLSTVTSLPAAVVALVVLGGPAGVESTLLFAHLRRSGARPGAVVRTRGLVSVAWVAGPPVAAGLVGAFGPRSLLVAVGAVATGTVVTTTAMLRLRAADRIAGAVPEPPEPPADDDRAGLRTVPVSRVTVLLAVVVFVVLQSANSATVSGMALLVTRSLHADVAWSGVALAVAAALEVPALLQLGPTRPDQPRPADLGHIKLSVAEHRRLHALALTKAAGLLTTAAEAFHLAWSRHRRHHQAIARWHHYQRHLRQTLDQALDPR